MRIDTPAPRQVAADDATIAGFMQTVRANTAEHFADCPCGRCQAIRASRPAPTVPLAYFPCCGATVKLVRVTGGGYSVIGKETHNNHCKELAA